MVEKLEKDINVFDKKSGLSTCSAVAKKCIFEPKYQNTYFYIGMVM